jgi:hypothetical protein
LCMLLHTTFKYHCHYISKIKLTSWMGLAAGWV